jgi:ABC-type transport system involved in cytochrome c biogenesis permease component
LLLCVLLPLTGGLIADARNTNAHPLFFIPSPPFTCFMAFDETARQVTRYWPNYYYTSLLTVHGLGWVLLASSCLIVPRTWHDKVQDSGARSRRFVRWMCAGSAVARLKLRRALLELNPFHWLTCRDRSKAFFVWMFLIIGATVWAWGLWKYPNTWKGEGVFIFSAMLTHAILKVWLATEATRQLGMDRRSGALELLLSTPITVRQIIRGQLLSLWKQFGPPSAVVVLTDLVFLSTEPETSWKLFWITIISVFVLDMITLSWVGMWLGLAHKHPSRAAASAVARVMALPWAIFLAIITSFMTLVHLARGPSPRWADEDATIILGAVIAIGLDVLLLSWARKRLLFNLRETATYRFEVRPVEPTATPVPAPLAQSA